jgi:phytoene dehydrogenase-like protein
VSNKKAIVIGAGISGLSAGCYLQKNGYDTEIFELHSIPGGLCTAWKKSGYTFDGCIHSIGGLNPRYKMHQYWNELIDLDQFEFHFYDELSKIIDTNGNTVRFYTDPDKLEQELISIAPEDTDFIRSFIKTVKHLSKYDTQLSKPIELWTPIDYYLSQFRTAPYMASLVKWRKSMQDMTRNCRSPFLKRVLNTDFFSHFPAYFFLFSVANLHNKNAGYPIGGSLPLALAIEKAYRKLGGKIHYNSKVTCINIENNRAIGITLENGEIYNGADVVISAADGHYTIFEMLEGKYHNKKIDDLYQKHPMWPSAVLVSFGLLRTFERESSQLELWLREPFVVDEQSRLDSLPITIYNFDSTLADEGKTCVRAILRTHNYHYWHDLKEDDSLVYEREKERVAQSLIEILDKQMGNIIPYVDVVDVATPATFYRYTNNWKGCTQGWEWLPGLIPETIKKELPGLKGFYMISQWVMPGGGVSSALVLGRDVTRIICKRDKKKFRVKLDK